MYLVFSFVHFVIFYFYFFILLFLASLLLFLWCILCFVLSAGIRKERGNYRSPLVRRVTRLSSQGRINRPKVLTGPPEASLIEPSPPAMPPEQLIQRIMEAEPPEIYLMKDMKRPLTEADVMMSLTNLADKELVHMISWAKKIPGTCSASPEPLRTRTFVVSLNITVT